MKYLLLFVGLSWTSPSVGQIGTSTYFCGFCHKGPYRTYQSAVAHTCATHNYLCAPAVPAYTGPSPEELKRKREQKDLKEASDDAVDKGVDCYEKRDWACAIRWFRESLEYDPDNEDASYNLRKAIENAKRDEEELIKKAIVETVTTAPPVIPPDPLSKLNEIQRKYMREADNIVVPPPSWESIIATNAEQLRVGHKNENRLLVGANTLVTAFDIVSSTPATAGGKALKTAFKVLLIGAKATIAAQQEADIVVFTKNATYERMLLMLKDAKQGPQVISIIKLLNENKAIPAGTNDELVRLVKACRQPEQGNSSVHMAMNAMLSTDAKAAFMETVSMEGMKMVSGEIRKMAGTAIQNRFTALREVNDKITLGQGYVKAESDPLNKSILTAQLEKLEKKMEPFNKLPEYIYKMVSQFDEVKKLVKEEQK
ncbi:MAG TPA: hypothetical protein VMZ03_12085 [Chitinophagaceae bacterium]|nr:hypothetical protein [Chitinophagaceae bacterium]